MKNKVISILLSVVIILSAFSLAACNDAGKPSPSEDGVLRIVCAGFVATDLCREVTGVVDDGSMREIILLGKAGMDMHSYEPTAADIISVSSADVFVYVGGESDGWVEGVLRSAGNRELITVSMTEVSSLISEELPEGAEHDDSCDLDHEHDHDRGTAEETAADEHVWLSLSNASRIVDAICDAVCRADAERADVYRQNADGYKAKLSSLSKDFAEMVSASKRNTVLVADRFPFIYMTRELGLEYFAAFPGCSTETDASFATQTFLIEKTKELGLPYIFIIDGSDGAVAEKISRETGAKILRLYSMQTVSDAELENGATYLDYMGKNFNSLKEALN